MQKLLEFIVAKKHWILFFLCEIISFVLIYRNNTYQHSMMLSSANVVTGKLLSMSGSVFSFFDLQKVNQELHERNSFLEMEVLKLREQVYNNEINSTSFNQVFIKDTVLSDSFFSDNYKYKYIPVGVVSNNYTYLKNYITINKGYDDGIRPDMGVVSPSGIVGIVATVKDHFSSVISLLNVNFRVSCKVQNTSFSGILSWKGGDVRYAYLDQLPTHAIFQIGDTILTSGYSALFPSGILVGTVESYSKDTDDNLYSLKVRLSTDFQSLNMLHVIDNSAQKEQKEIEMEARKND